MKLQYSLVSFDLCFVWNYPLIYQNYPEPTKLKKSGQPHYEEFPSTWSEHILSLSRTKKKEGTIS